MNLKSTMQHNPPLRFNILTLNVSGTGSANVFPAHFQAGFDPNDANSISWAAALRDIFTCWRRGRVAFLRAPVVAHGQAATWQVVISLSAENQMRLVPNEPIISLSQWKCAHSEWRRQKLRTAQAACHIPATGEGFRRTTHRVFHCGQVCKEPVNNKEYPRSLSWSVEIHVKAKKIGGILKKKSPFFHL